jgi:hypothetical protein
LFACENYTQSRQLIIEIFFFAGYSEAALVIVRGDIQRRKKMPYIELKKEYYSPNEIGAMAGVSRQTVIAWIKSGHIHAEQTETGWWKIPASEIKGMAPVQRIELTIK